MMHFPLCYYHNYELDTRGIHPNPNPEITCQICRAQGYFSEEEITEYERSFCLVAIYQRPLGYPEKLHVIMEDDDDETTAIRIAPGGSFRFCELSRRDPYLVSDNNTIVLRKPLPGCTLEDNRERWDHAPDYCY